MNGDALISDILKDVLRESNVTGVKNISKKARAALTAAAESHLEEIFRKAQESKAIILKASHFQKAVEAVKEKYEPNEWPHPDVLKRVLHWDELTCARAAESGNLEMLKWARRLGCPWDKRICELAAEGGHLEVLKWARHEGCPWDGLTCAYAARGGHLDVLKWATENGCPWDQRTLEWAAENGQSEALNWMAGKKVDPQGSDSA